MQTEAAAAKALVSMESPAVCVPPLSTGAVPRVACPRCQSMDTKFCYLNNYNPNQPRWLCKSCQRYWTAGGTLRNVQPGAGRRKNKQSGSAEVPPVATSLAPSPSARPQPPPKEGSADGSGTEPEDAVLRPRSTRRRTQRARRGDSTSAAAPDGATPTPSPPQSSAPPLPLPWFAWSPAAALAAAHAPAGFPMCWAFDPSAAMWPYAMAAQQQAAAAQASLAAAQHVRLGSCDAPQLSRPKALYASGFHAPSGEAAGSLYGGLSHPALVPTPGPGAASLWANPSAFARSLALQQQACEQASAGAAKRQREGGDATQG